MSQLYRAEVRNKQGKGKRMERVGVGATVGAFLTLSILLLLARELGRTIKKSENGQCGGKCELD